MSVPIHCFAVSTRPKAVPKPQTTASQPSVKAQMPFAFLYLSSLLNFGEKAARKAAIHAKIGMRREPGCGLLVGRVSLHVLTAAFRANLHASH